MIRAMKPSRTARLPRPPVPRRARPSCRALGLLALALALLACSTREQPRAEPTQPPTIADGAFVAADGYRLPMDRSGPEEPRAVILALHGFTDHRGAFDRLGEAIAADGIAVYSYDQRGFGETRSRGIWAGQAAYVADAREVWHLLARRYAERPVYLLGESMGGAVGLLATTGPDAIEPPGLILSAPAVWGRSVMPWYQRLALWLGEHTVPGLSFSPTSARRIADAQPTDDPEVIAELRADEHMLRDVRTDMLVGMSDLMDSALATSPRMGEPALLLYGLEDEIVPPEATCNMLRRIERADAAQPTVAIYPDGYHLLTRDLQAADTIADIRAFVADPTGDLASGRELPVSEARARVCSA